MKYQFRGYCEDNKKWVYGYPIAKNIILSKEKAYLVDEKSISIWTQAYDSKGKKIFTNDVVYCKNDGLLKIEFRNFEFVGVSLDNDEDYSKPLLCLYNKENAIRVIATDYIK